jgi:hypothetical protein
VIKAQPKADQPQPINLGLIRPLADSAEKVKFKKAKRRFWIGETDRSRDVDQVNTDGRR